MVYKCKIIFFCMQVVSAAALPPVAQTTTIVATSPLRLRSPSPPPLAKSPLPQLITKVAPDSPCPSPPPTSISPSSPEQRLPSVLEAAIKAEPKVEVERLPSPPSGPDDVTPQAR